MRHDEQRDLKRKLYQSEGEHDWEFYHPAEQKKDIFDESRVFRVCAYCRVSTDNDEQLSSFELQNQHYRQLVGAHKNWDLRHIYADEGISGTSLKKRDQFNEMIARCEAGEYDLIVTKSVSRFARNLVDCVSLIRKLKAHNPPIGVFFETDGLNTFSEESELKLSILASFAQEESVKKSESMVWSLKERFKNKKLLTPELFGYTRPRDAAGHFIKYAPLEIYEPEAVAVRFIFNAFLGGYTLESIAEILTETGIPTKVGNTVWKASSIKYILTNERYAGCVLTWKTFTCDVLEHKKARNMNDRDQILYNNTHPPIVTREIFDAAQRLYAEHSQGMRGGYNIMHVIDMGVFQGYVPINHRWTNDDPSVYYEASENAPKTPMQPQKVKRAYFSQFDLTGYQVVRGQFMAARSELPCITVSADKITFNVSCTRKFVDIPNVQLLLHPKERKIAIRPCSKADVYSISWQTKEKPLPMKSISCPHFLSALYQIMEWNPDYYYRIVGTWIAKGDDQIIIFNLFNAMPVVLVEEDDEERKRRMAICPEEWGDSFGEEFYDSCIDNSLYYAPGNETWRLSQKSTPLTGQLDFPIMSSDELKASEENLKMIMEKTDD